MPEATRGHRRRTAGGARQVRMEEVARAAGVSLASVSRALRDPTSVSAGVYERVRDVADRLGYSRSPIASSMSSARSPIIGVIVPTMTNAFFNRTIQAISLEMEASNYQLMIGVHEYDQAREEKLIGAFLRWNPLGLVVTGIFHTRASNNLLAGAACPVVEMWDLDGRPIDSVIGFSMTEDGRTMACHLIDKGRRHLVFVGHILDRDPRAKARAKAFLEEIERHEGVTGTIVHVDDRTIAMGIAAIGRIRHEHSETDGVAFSGDAVALGALVGAEALGIRVPDDIAVIGFGDLDLGGYSRPPLTTIRPPHAEMGRSIARHILDRVLEPKATGEVVDLGFELIERAST